MADLRKQRAEVSGRIASLHKEINLLDKKWEAYKNRPSDHPKPFDETLRLRALIHDLTHPRTRLVGVASTSQIHDLEALQDRFRIYERIWKQFEAIADRKRADYRLPPVDHYVADPEKTVEIVVDKIVLLEKDSDPAFRLAPGDRERLEAVVRRNYEKIQALDQSRHRFELIRKDGKVVFHRRP